MENCSDVEGYRWSKLNHLQVGKYGEYFAKMEFLKYGFHVYSAEVDDKGIDFVARYENGSSYYKNQFIEAQVKSFRKTISGVFIKKDKFVLRESLYLVLVQLAEGKAPELYLIPSTAWDDKKSNEIFVARNYDGKKSPPEYGINQPKGKEGFLQKYLLKNAAGVLVATQKGRRD